MLRTKIGMVCQARNCKCETVSYTCGGYFCPQHKEILLRWHKALGIAKLKKDVFLEYRCRLAMKNIRTFDPGHYHRFLIVQQAVRDAVCLRMSKMHVSRPMAVSG